MQAVTILAIGDPHFKVSNTRETDRMADAIIKVANERSPDIIVVLGDVLDRHEIIHISPLSRSIGFLARLMVVAPVYVLIGNHDLKNNRQFLSEEHPFVALKFWGERMTIVDKVVSTTIRGHEFVFVPYVPPGRFEEALNTITHWKEAECIFGHQEFKGAQMGALISAEGDDWPLSYPYVVSGHIHNYQELRGNILYPGTPIQHSFGDSHDKTISYLEFCGSRTPKGERIGLGLPRKYIQHLTCSEVANYEPNLEKELKIIISGTSGDIKAIMKHPNISNWKSAGYKVVYKTVSLDIQQLPMPSKHVKFSSLLYNTIGPDLKPTYSNIFGKPVLTLKINRS